MPPAGPVAVEGAVDPTVVALCSRCVDGVASDTEPIVGTAVAVGYGVVGYDVAPAVGAGVPVVDFVWRRDYLDCAVLLGASLRPLDDFDGLPDFVQVCLLSCCARIVHGFTSCEIPFWNPPRGVGCKKGESRNGTCENSCRDPASLFLGLAWRRRYGISRG